MPDPERQSLRTRPRKFPKDPTASVPRTRLTPFFAREYIRCARIFSPQDHADVADARPDPPRKPDHGDPLPAPPRLRGGRARRAAGRARPLERPQAARHHDRPRPARARIRRPAVRLLPRRASRAGEPVGPQANHQDVLRQLAGVGDGGAARHVEQTRFRTTNTSACRRCSSADARETIDEHPPSEPCLGGAGGAARESDRASCAWPRRPSSCCGAAPRPPRGTACGR